MATFAKLKERVQEMNPGCDAKRLEEAFVYAKKRFDGLYHSSGETYVQHVLLVALNLLDFHPDDNMIIAALLHSLPNTNSYDPTNIEKHFGSDVADLVVAMERLNIVKKVDQKTELENLRKMFLAMAKDIRVVLLLLADRLQTMSALESEPASVRKTQAQKTMSIYAPIAARLGIYTYKGLLEDLSFKILSPRQYENLLAQLKDYQFKRGRSMEETKKELDDFLKANNISAVVDGRIKNVYSIYKKLKIKNHTTISDIHDIFAIRVILPTKRTSRGEEAVDHLYAVLGLIHSKWRPIPNRFKDYVAMPKPNGYKSLHTAVLGLSIDSPNQSTEIQIRSQKMHEEAEFGVASHWLYEDMKKALNRYHTDRNARHGVILETEPARNYLQWIEALSSVQKELQEGKDFSESMGLDVFSDRIFVLTPQGQVKDLPLGSTPLDFAYSVHTDLGNRCVHARVNGVVVPLNYELKNGEVVEIETNAKANPKLHWVSFVKTVSAKNKIRAFFRGLDKDRSFRDGRELINKHLLKLKKPLLDDDLSLFRFYNGKRLSYKERVGLIEEIGNGSVLPAPVVRKALGQAEVRPVEALSADETSKVLLPKIQQKRRAGDSALTISGETGVPYRFASCCKPTDADAIVAYVTRGHAVTVHKESCKVLRQADQSRLIDANWGGHVDYHRFPVKVRLTAQDRIGLIRDIADVISSANINILDFGKEQRLEREIEREMILEVISQDQFQDVLQKLRRVRNIVGVQQSES